MAENPASGTPSTLKTWNSSVGTSGTRTGKREAPANGDRRLVRSKTENGEARVPEEERLGPAPEEEGQKKTSSEKLEHGTNASVYGPLHEGI